MMNIELNDSDLQSIATKILAYIGRDKLQRACDEAMAQVVNSEFDREVVTFATGFTVHELFKKELKFQFDKAVTEAMRHYVSSEEFKGLVLNTVKQKMEVKDLTVGIWFKD